MTLQEAIVARHSVRQYKNQVIETDKVEQLRAAIDEANRTAGLHMQLVTDEPEAFAKGLDEQLGYNGERVVLLAQTLGLNSCWVGLTFSKQPDQYTIDEGETLHGVIALGYGLTQGVQHPVRPTEKYYRSAVQPVPEWFLRGMDAAMLAPTAMHMQKFEFELLADGRVAARTRFSLVNSYLKIDLGIVKCHFELGAGSENVRWA